MQEQIKKVRTHIISSVFPEEEIIAAIMKASENLSDTQFSNMYKFLLTERTALIKMFEQDKPEIGSSADRTMQILKARYGK
jgi:hypothetical protein